MKYDLFLFDLDDTLLDFRASEKLSFARTLESLGIISDYELLFSDYRAINADLWKKFEENKVTKDFLKVERFRKTFSLHGLDADPLEASARYLETLPETVVLIDHAAEICEWVRSHGELGIITNGIQSVQSLRVQNSRIAPYVNFICVSDECGFAKPDVRFFEYTTRKSTKFSRASTIIIGDREDADILGGHNFGIDSCWFNPDRKVSSLQRPATFHIQHLSELKSVLL